MFGVGSVCTTREHRGPGREDLILSKKRMRFSWVPLPVLCIVHVIETFKVPKNKKVSYGKKNRCMKECLGLLILFLMWRRERRSVLSLGRRLNKKEVPIYTTSLTHLLLQDLLMCVSLSQHLTSISLLSSSNIINHSPTIAFNSSLSCDNKVQHNGDLLLLGGSWDGGITFVHIFQGGRNILHV